MLKSTSLLARPRPTASQLQTRPQSPVLDHTPGRVGLACLSPPINAISGHHEWEKLCPVLVSRQRHCWVKGCNKHTFRTATQPPTAVLRTPPPSPATLTPPPLVPHPPLLSFRGRLSSLLSDRGHTNIGGAVPDLCLLPCSPLSESPISITGHLGSVALGISSLRGAELLGNGCTSWGQFFFCFFRDVVDGLDERGFRSHGGHLR